ncbi:MAG: GspH/FimT family pseudopilin [Candidatus Omnitrophota bacterium]
MRKTNGFTVIELLVTLALIAILVGMGIGIGRQTIDRANFTSILNQFVADLSYARQLASRDNRYVAFHFNDEGTGYTMLVQTGIGLDLSDTSNYTEEKTVDPLNGEQFLGGTTGGACDFAINSMGIIRKYPVDIDASPITVSLEFFKKDQKTGVCIYKKILTIFPSGGYKIENKND